MDGKSKVGLHLRIQKLIYGSSAVFQAGGLVVVLVEVVRKAYLASIVPVIVNAILNEHQLVVDIIAFVSRGDFPRSRLGEKQRGKILASWVTRKMRTIAQFGIRDPDGADSQITEVPEQRMSRIPSLGGSLTMVDNRGDKSSTIATEKNYSMIPAGIAEMPANYESSIMESPPLPLARDNMPQQDVGFPEDYPNEYSNMTDEQQQHQQTLRLNGSSREQKNSSDYYQDQPNHPNKIPHVELPAFEYSDHSPPLPRYDSKPTLSLPSLSSSSVPVPGPPPSDSPPPPPRPENDLWTLPSQKSQSRFSQHLGNGNGFYQGLGSTGGGGGGLRVANKSPEDDEDEIDTGTDGWPEEALMHMNLGGRSGIGIGSGSGGRGMNQRGGVGGGRAERERDRERERQRETYDGSGYGSAL